MVERYGAENLAALAGSTTTISGVPVSDQSPVDSTNVAASGSSVATPAPISGASGGGNLNINIGVTVNDNSSSTTTSTSGNTGADNQQFGQKLAAAIKQAVQAQLAEETRVGGMMRRQSLRYT